MKRYISILFLLIAVLFASTALAGTPIRGKTRVYGYKDEVKTPGNKFAPYVVYLDVPFVENRYAEFHYIRENTKERHWQIEIVDSEGNTQIADGNSVRVYLPYPSIWSEANQAYWKWTQTYAEKHYTWHYALGESLDVSDNGNNYISLYSRGDYFPVREMSKFGPYVDLNTKVFGSGLTVWIKFSQY